MARSESSLQQLPAVAFDASCLMPNAGLTGVGYYSLYLLRALLKRRDALSLRLFAASAQPAPVWVRELAAEAEHAVILRVPTRLHTLLWTGLEWPPMEWFTGPVDIVHGGFHLLPAARHAKRVVTVFDLTGFRFPGHHTRESINTHRRLLQHAAKRADAFIAISESSRRDMVALLGVDPARIHVVYAGVALEEFNPPLNPSTLAHVRAKHGIEERYLIHLGTLEPRKNLPRLLEAYARARNRVADCPQLVLAGGKGWGYEPIWETIERLGLADHVRYTGYLPRDEAVVLLRGAHACVYPSLYEGFGMPVLEAMAARTPVLTSNASSLPEVIGDTGITVDPESTEAVEEGLVMLLHSYDAALERADAAYERAKSFTWEKSAEQLLRAYDVVLGRPTK